MVAEEVGDVEQVAQDLKVIGGRELVVTAISQDLAGDLFLEPGERGRQVTGAETDPRRDNGLQVLDEMIAADVSFQASLQMAGLPVEAGEKGSAKILIGAIEQEVRAGEPSVNAKRQGIGMPGEAIRSWKAHHPMADQAARCRRRADRCQIVEPVEIMQMKAPKQRLVERIPIGRGAEVALPSDQTNTAGEDAPTVLGIARPRTRRPASDGRIATCARQSAS